MVALGGFDGSTEEHEPILRNHPAHGAEQGFGVGQMFGKHGGDDAVITFAGGGAVGLQRIPGRKFDPAGMTRNLQKPVGHRNGRRADVHALHLEIRTFLRSEQAQHTVPAGQFQHPRVLRQLAQEIVPEQGEVIHHRGPEGVDENGSPHVWHHVAFVLVNARHDLRHGFGSVPPGALVNLLGLGNAQTILCVAAGGIGEGRFPISLPCPFRQRVQQPGNQFPVGFEICTGAGSKHLCFPIHRFQKRFCLFHMICFFSTLLINSEKARAGPPAPWAGSNPLHPTANRKRASDPA